MARFGLENIDRDFFWELVDEGYVSYSIIDAYLYMLSQKLSKDTDIHFRVENGYLYNDEIGFKIPTSTITTYDNLLKDIEKFLSENAQENEFGVDTNKLANQWAYIFSHTEMSPYYEGDGHWKAYDDYSQKRVWEALYFMVFGKYHDNMDWAFDTASEYLIKDGNNYNEKFHFKGTVSELDNISVTFAKNGNISVKNPSKEYLEKLQFFYDVCDPKNKNHAR